MTTGPARYLPALAGILVLLVLALFANALTSTSSHPTSNPNSHISIPTFDIASLGAPDPAIVRLLPHGPTRLVLRTEISPTVTASITGYVDFTANPDACSFDLLASSTDPAFVTRLIRDPYSPAQAREISGPSAATTTSFSPAGVPWAIALLPITFAPGSSYIYDGQAISPRGPSLFCRFPDIAYYTRLDHLTHRLTPIIPRVNAIARAATAYNNASLIKALDVAHPARELRVLDSIAAPSLSQAYSNITWKLISTGHTLEVLVYDSTPARPLRLLTTMTFTPTAPMNVPRVPVLSPVSAEISFLGGKNNALAGIYKLH